MFKYIRFIDVRVLSIRLRRIGAPRSVPAASGSGGGNETRALPDYSDPDFPNTTLTEGDYKATRASESANYDKPSVITSDTVQLPGFSKKGIFAKWAFYLHSYSSKESKEPQKKGWSLGCQVLPDEALKKYNDMLDAFSVGIGDSYGLRIGKDKN